MRLAAAVMEQAEGMHSRRAIALEAIDNSDAGTTMNPILRMPHLEGERP